MPEEIQGRITKIEAKLDEHGRDISSLKESAMQLARAQQSQAESIRNLSDGFDKVLGEIGETRKDVVTAVEVLADQFQSFERDWKATCIQRHQMTDFRLTKVEKVGERALEEIDQMSEAAKTQYIQELQSQIKEFKERDKAELRQSRLWKMQWFKLLSLIIGGLLTGGGGTVLIQWMLSHYR